MEFILNKKLKNNNYFKISMNITEEYYNEVIEHIQMELLKKYFNNPLTFCQSELNYTDFQITTFDSMPIQEKVEHIQKIAKTKLTPEYLYEKYFKIYI